MTREERNKHISWLRSQVQEILAIIETVLIEAVGIERARAIFFNSQEKARRWYCRRKDKYPEEWNRSLKERVKKRDGHKCVECKAKDSLLVHHIDYDKSNCDMDNLITLCWGCHGKTLRDDGNRWKWKLYYDCLLKGVS